MDGKDVQKFLDVGIGIIQEIRLLRKAIQAAAISQVPGEFRDQDLEEHYDEYNRVSTENMASLKDKLGQQDEKQK